MKTFLHADALPEFRNKWVGDLAWAITSPSLIESCGDPDSHVDGIAILQDQWCGGRSGEILDWLRDLDEHPAPLNDWMDGARDRRLGALFERLLCFWLESGPSPWRMVCNSLQVIDEKRTLGEMDFILEDLGTGRFFSVEVAVKFYIGVGEMLSMDDFVGPRVMDRLGRKWRHLVGRQCRLHQEPASRIALEPYTGSHPVQPAMLIKGRLFVPWSVYSRTEEGGSPRIPLENNFAGLVGGWWMCCREFADVYDGHTAVILRKLDYFGPLNPAISPTLNRLVVGPDIRSGFFLDNEKTPVACSVIDQVTGGEKSRGWIVPDDWKGLHPAG